MRSERVGRHLEPLRFGLVLCVLAGLVVAGCISSPASPTNNAPYSQVDLQLGTGPAAANGQSLTVNYTGWLYDSTQPDEKGAAFDTSGATPFMFTLGTGAVIAGWDQGVVGMQVGGVRRLVIPPSLGYGAVRHGAIPPNATMVFEIQLTAIGTS